VSVLSTSCLCILYPTESKIIGLTLIDIAMTLFAYLLVSPRPVFVKFDHAI